MLRGGWRSVSGKAVVNTRTGKVNSSALRAEVRRVVAINRRGVTVSVQRRYMIHVEQRHYLEQLLRCLFKSDTATNL